MGTKLAAVAPLVLPMDAACSSVEGFISVALGPTAIPHQLWIRLSGIANGSLHHARLEMDPQLQALLSAQTDLVALRLRETPGLAPFLVELRNLVSQAAAAAPAQPFHQRGPAFYRAVKADLDALGWIRVLKLADDLSSFTLRCVDASERSHDLSISLPPQYPAASPRCIADLPGPPFAPVWGAAAAEPSLSNVAAQFEAEIEASQRLWDELEDLDAHAWVLEPTAPARSCTYRRLALANHVTLAVALAAPFDPAAIPELQIMGADRDVQPLLDGVRKNRAMWQPAGSLRENLQTLLAVQLPTKPTEGAEVMEDMGTACAICYNYRRPVEAGNAEGESPEVHCDNAPCGKPFHRVCLVEWLGADPTTKQVFTTIYGACPYCSSPVAVDTR